MSDRFTIFRSTYDALKAMPPDVLKETFVMIGNYAMDDILPEAQDGVAYGLFLSIRPLIDVSKKRSAAGKTTSNTKQTASSQNQNASNEHQNDPIKIKEESKKIKEESKNKRFVPPTVEEVGEYIATQGFNIDAEKFVDYYECNGWMAGKNKMKDWKAAVRNWNRTQRQGFAAEANKRQEKTANRFNNFSGREYDYGLLEKQLLEAQRRKTDAVENIQASAS